MALEFCNFRAQGLLRSAEDPSLGPPTSGRVHHLSKDISDDAGIGNKQLISSIIS
jgi:hypothetical protein